MQRIRESVDEYMYQRNFSGAVSIRLDQEQLYLRSFGFRDHPNKIPNTCGTLFGIASGTKTFTALGVLRLVESGQLDLTTPVTDIIGDVPYIHRSAVVRQLLNHTSGIYDYYDEELIQDFDNYSVEIPWSKLETPSDYLPLFESKEKKFMPGTKVSYSNGGYVLLGVIIEKVSGQLFRHYMGDQVFEPLNMKSTGFYAFNDLPPNTAWGYMSRGEKLVSNIYQLPIRGGGDGGLYTNVEDLHSFWVNLFKGELISAGTLAKMINEEVDIFGNQKYGLGVYVSDFRGRKAYAASGCDCGVGFESVFVPDIHLNINICSNLSDGAGGILPFIMEALGL